MRLHANSCLLIDLGQVFHLSRPASIAASVQAGAQGGWLRSILCIPVPSLQRGLEHRSVTSHVAEKESSPRKTQHRDEIPNRAVR